MHVTTATSYDEAARGSDVAILPVGSFEQHGGHLPLSRYRRPLILRRRFARIGVPPEAGGAPQWSISEVHDQAVSGP